MTTMPTDEPSSIQTRLSLLRRLKTGEDVASWQEFYGIYGKLVRDFAIHAGLGDTEADDVVQETAIAMARHLPGYRYDPKVCRFKTWLLNQASWRIKDQLKKREREAVHRANPRLDDDPARTSTIHRVPDPAAADLEAVFETQWRNNLFTAALARVKEKFSLKQFQIFDLLVLQGWPAKDVTRSLGLTLANVYVTRHRMSAAIKKEVKRLEKQFEEAAQRQLEPVQPENPAPKG
ncbi:MAG TPA: sigma-70 family RNA polymerase sigma factor [Verrucomicrobiae bacterium]|jgi:RNA polymerase sigma-70 factor (ECF subfamily)|nr:sigma-70 family RNA polymerase sigma factor [Verrucomicrobiae bacterium]